jgi:hypothetical protein
VRFYDPVFYVVNASREWRRWEWLSQPSGDALGAWLTLLALLLALLAGARLLRAGKAAGFVSVFGPFVTLALLDASKARIYASLAVPVVCFGLAMTLTGLPAELRRATSMSRAWTAAACVLIAWIVADGFAGYRFIAREAAHAMPYSFVGERIAALLNDPVPVFGSQRWWWAMHGYPYRSLSAQWDIWQVEQRAGRSPDFGLMLAKRGGAYLILDNDTRGDLSRVPRELNGQVEDILTSGASLIASWQDPTYGLLQIYRF